MLLYHMFLLQQFVTKNRKVACFLSKVFVNKRKYLFEYTGVYKKSPLEVNF